MLVEDFAARLDRRAVIPHPTPKAVGAALTLIVGLIVLFGGYRKMTDIDLPESMIGRAHGIVVPINPYQGFKFEGVLADGQLYLLGKLGLGAEPTAFVFWATGMAAVAAALAWGLRDGSIGVPALLLAVAFTRIVDTLSMWIGKTDPWLVAFLVLSASRVRGVSRLGIVLAPFVHPTIALLSTLGLLTVEACYGRRPRWGDAALALASTTVALLAFRLLFPALQGRGGYMFEQLAYLGLRGAEDGLPSIVTGVLAPAAALLLLAGVRQGTHARWRLVLVAWLLGIALLTSFLTLDHTRDACLVTFATALAWLRHQDLRSADLFRGAAAGTFLALFVSRLAIPHYDQDGAHVFRWPPITRWSEPLIARIFEADKARCADAPLRCVYHRNPAPEIRVPTL